MGYYHERPDAVSDEDALFRVIAMLAEDGVAVVAAAGNGSTTEHFWPAALSQNPNRAIPVAAVGALNPTGKAAATFSNTGEWVTHWHPGVAVVSTMPTTLEGSLRGDLAVPAGHGSPARETPDPDCYATGFGVWSGTSFAAPCCAGGISQLLATKACGSVAEAVTKALGGAP